MARGRGEGENTEAALRKPAYSPKRLQEHWREAIEYLDDRYSFWLTDVLNMGKPEWTQEVDTAAVAPSKKDSKEVIAGTTNYRFLFNPEFAMKLDTEELAFVASHETMHMALNHLDWMRGVEDKQQGNIALDCLINDYLRSQGMKQPEGTIVGQDTVGYDCAYVTGAQIYSDLERMKQQQPEKYQQIIDQFGEGGEGAMDSHTWLNDPDSVFGKGAAEAMQESIEKALEEGRSNGLPQSVEDKKDDQPAMSQGQGSEAGNMRGFMEQSGVTLEFAKLLKELDPDIFKNPGVAPRPQVTFRRSPRKMYQFFPDLVLPTYEKQEEKQAPEKPMIVLALDTSGSVRQETVNRFLTLAKSIPQERVRLFPCTFTTRYKPLDLDNPQPESGGTCFSAVEDYIREQVMPEMNGRYPKSVVVITDGDATFRTSAPDEKQREGWYWLLEDNYVNEDSFRKRFFGRVSQLKKFTRD